MRDTVERFSDRVANYVKYRPDYPAEVLRLFRDAMDLQENSVVADIGAGTGISTRLFLANGNRVFGVEPNAKMREAATEFLRDFPKFESVDGTSEKTDLPDESVDFVVAAQAFHWFDAKKSRREFARILREGGFIALFWNERRLDANEFLREYENLLMKFGTDYQQVRHEKISDESLQDFFQTDFQRARFLNEQTLDFDGLKGRLQSASYTPAENSHAFPAMIKELRSLFAEHAENGKIQILYDTNVFYAKI